MYDDRSTRALCVMKIRLVNPTFYGFSMAFSLTNIVPAHLLSFHNKAPCAVTDTSEANGNSVGNLYDLRKHIIYQSNPTPMKMI